MEAYWFWLCSNFLPEPNLMRRLLEQFKTPWQIFQAEEPELLHRFPEHRQKIKKLCESRKIWNLEKEQEELQKKGLHFFSWEHPRFPERLRKLADCPVGLFLKGNFPVETTLSVAIVGARTCSTYGKELALWFGRELASQGVQVISGMARGVDGYSHRGALSADGKTFAVLGGGADICYPRENLDVYNQLEQNGGIISETPPGVQGLPYLFPLRNRIISGLSDAVLIIEAKEKSGSLITADFALEQGKDVFAVPGRLGDSLSDGCNNLIRQGAGIAISPEKLLEDLCFLAETSIISSQKNKIALERSENLVYSCLSLQAQNLEQVCAASGLSPAEVLRILTKLELLGCIKEVYKNYYIRQ